MTGLLKAWASVSSETVMALAFLSAAISIGMSIDAYHYHCFHT